MGSGTRGRRAARNATSLSAAARISAWISAFVWTLFALAPPASASVQCPNGGNQVANCGFEADTAGWTKIMGDSFARSATRAHTGGFSALVNAENFSSSYYAEIETCVQNVAPGTLYLFGGWYYLSGASAGADCAVSIEELGTSISPCGGAHVEGFDVPSDPTLDTWEEILSKFQSNAATEDVRLTVACSDTSFGFTDFQVWFDDPHLIPYATIFIDRFESQNSCAWSSSVGGACP